MMVRAIACQARWGLLILVLAAAGFVLQEQFDFLPREYFLVFGLNPAAR
jgi:hypothetical protein